MTAASVPATAPRRSGGFFEALAPGGRRALFLLAMVAVCLLFAFPVLWLMLTSLRPGYAVFYVHRGTDFTLENFHEVLGQPVVLKAMWNSFVISTLATILSLGVTVTSGYMLSRFKGPIPNTWFSLIYVFRCVPYVSWVLPLYFVTRALGIFDTYWGLLLPHVAVHVCFFSWIMKGFFDGIDPSMEYAAMIDGCSRWGAFWRVAMPAAIPGLTALAILCWLYTWNEFLFALILTAHETPILTVVMAQFVHELGMEWHLMSATAVLSLGPALLVTVFGQKYVIRGLKV
ncbi:MAG: carbohydrate ABC transporter permease [Alphaproteobacteria bacterium]